MENGFISLFFSWATNGATLSFLLSSSFLIQFSSSVLLPGKLRSIRKEELRVGFLISNCVVVVETVASGEAFFNQH